MKALLLILMVNTFCLAQEWELKNQQEEGRQPISVIQQIKNQIIEEYETQVLRLTEYVSGSLLNFHFKLETNASTSRDELLDIAYKTIKIVPGTANLAYKYMPESDLSGTFEPFARSSVMIGNEQGQLKLYMIDRNFNFISYCVEDYLDNIIKPLQFSPLDKKIVNGSCTDLKDIRMTDDDKFLMAFCISNNQRVSRELIPTESYLTVIQIRNYEEAVSDIAYYTMNFEEFMIDFSNSVRFVGNYTGLNPAVPGGMQQSFGLFMASMYDNPEEFKELPRFIAINFTVFDEMRSLNQTSKYVPKGGLLAKRSLLNLTNHQKEANIIDFKAIFKTNEESYYGPVTNSTTLNLAIVLEGYGVMLCYIAKYKEKLLANKTLDCIDNVNAFLHLDQAALSVHYEPDQPEQKLFLVSAYPPKVTEYNINDFRNSKIDRIYIAQLSATKRYVAMNYLAVNQNWVLLLMKDMYNNQQVIRVYTRTSTFFRIVMTDINLPPMSRANFIGFPNYYFNYFIYRDERTVNITRISNQKMIFNRSEGMQQILGMENYQKLNNQDFNLTLYHKNKITMDSDFDQELATFNVKFVDRYNTQMFKVLDFPDSQVDLFYSCGDKNYKFDISNLYNGPEYILNMSRPEGMPGYFDFTPAGETFKFNASIDSKNCEESLLIPIKDDKYIVNTTMLLVCITKQNAKFVSYRLTLDNQNQNPDNSQHDLLLDNEISVPYTNLHSYIYDSSRQLIIALLRINDPTI